MTPNKRLIRGLLVTIAIAIVAGCAQTPRHELSDEYHEWAFTEARTTDLPRESHVTLELAQVGDLISLGTTNLGGDTQFLIAQRYFAASGRPCFRGQLTSNSREQQMIVCRYSRERWVATRAVAETFNGQNTPEVVR